jgi:outer membrane receptor protein involved in Fe transport
MFSYAHNDTATTQAIDKSTIGQSFLGHIADQFSVLGKYSFRDGELKGLSAGVGLAYASKALQNYQGSVARYNPSTFYAEAFAAYPFKVMGYRTHVQLNVKNLTRQHEYFGWKATGSSTRLATQPYEIPTAVRYALTIGLDF